MNIRLAARHRDNGMSSSIEYLRISGLGDVRPADEVWLVGRSNAKNSNVFGDAQVIQNAMAKIRDRQL